MLYPDDLSAKEQTEIVLEDPHHVSRQRPVWPPAEVCDVHGDPPARLELAGALGEHIEESGTSSIRRESPTISLSSAR